MSKRKFPKGSYLEKKNGRVYRIVPSLDAEGAEDGELARVDVTDGEPDDWGAVLAVQVQAVAQTPIVSSTAFPVQTLAALTPPAVMAEETPKAKLPLTPMQKVKMTNGFSSVALSQKVKELIIAEGGEYGVLVYDVFVSTIEKELAKIMGVSQTNERLADELESLISQQKTVVQELIGLSKNIQNSDVAQTIGFIAAKLGGQR